MCRYGLSGEDYNKIYNNQSGRCLGCGRHRSEFKNNLCVDHDHKTGKIRGLLCDDCNLSLGRLQDSVETLRKLIEYLIKNKE
jgi:hypothetical protein